MRFRRPKLKFALDEGVPNAVGRALEESGHRVVYLNKGDLVARGAKDTLVCAFAIMNDLILVASDGDMKVIAKANGATGSIYAKLNLLKLSCTPPEAAERVKVMMTLIEHEWHVGAEREGRRLFVEVQSMAVRSNR